MSNGRNIGKQQLTSPETRGGMYYVTLSLSTPHKK